MNIELPIGCTDDTSLSSKLASLADTNKYCDPAIAIHGTHLSWYFFQAGVNGLVDDRLGHMYLTPRGVKRRNQMVLEAVHQYGVGLVITMVGGYPRHEWKPIIDDHNQVDVGA
jgi:acetoin utilization deacetylase AcuC-like enzyme